MLAGLGLNHDPWANVVETVSLTTGWQTFTYTITTTGVGDADSRVLFDMGAEVGTVFIDDVSVEIQGTPGELLTNGSFDDGFNNWINAGGVVQESNNIYQAEVAVAGNPYDVNLSQVITLVPDETYTLTFRAKASVARTMLAGLGLNHDPWANVVETVSLTTGWQTFTYTITTTGFGDADSRVLFDMGAEVGTVFIDGVSLTVAGGGGGGGATGELTTNGDFETGDFTGTVQFLNGGTQTITTVNPSSGTYSANLNVVATQSDTVLKFANLSPGAFTPGQTVTISFDMRGSLDPGGVAFAEFFSELSGGGTSAAEILFGGGPIFPNADPNVWTNFSTTALTGSDTSGGVTLQLKAATGGGSLADIYFDNVSVTVGP